MAEVNHTIPVTPFGSIWGGGYNDRHDDGLAELIQAQGIHAGHANIQSDIADAARDTVDAARDAINATNQIGNLNLSATERNGGETRANIYQAAGEVKDQAAFHANQTSRDFSNLQREICEVRSEFAQEFGTTRLEAAKQHAEAVLKATEQHCALQAQIAECCCETKELIRAENAQTRQLMQSNLIDEANRRTAEAERELLLAKIQAGQSNGPGNSGN